MTPYNPSAQHIVLDLETLSTKPNAAVISIGAVALDSEGNFLGEFHQALNPDQPGRDVDLATIQWWESQSAEAQEASYKAKDTVTATVGMYMFSAWICCVGVPEKVKMWGNGSSFDCTILSSLYDQSHELRHPKPWAWWDDRDMRTLLDAFPAAKDVGEFVGVKHHALHDARHEAKQLAKALQLKATQHSARLTKPAKVGNGTFCAGVPERMVIEAAQRLYERDDAERKASPEELAAQELARRNLWEAIHGPLPIRGNHPALPTRPQVADALLAEVAGKFTREDDLPNELLRRIDAYLTSEGYTE